MSALEVMRRDAAKMRDSGPTLFTSVRNNDGVKDVVDAILGAWRASGAAKR
jgi:urease accessory protein